MVVGGDFIHRQVFVPQIPQMPLGIIHPVLHRLQLLLSGSRAGFFQNIRAFRVHHKADTLVEFQQTGGAEADLILHLVLIERNDLIEVDLLALSQRTDTGIFIYLLGCHQNGGRELGAVGIGLLMYPFVCPQPSQVSLMPGSRASALSSRTGQYQASFCSES